LAPLLGAVHLRSDVERKRLAGMAEQQKSGADIGQGIYSRAANERVVEHLLGCADDVLDGGFAVIVDATFGRRSDRGRFRQLAARHGVELRLIHCHAPGAVLESRIRGRQQAGLDASEADLAVLAWQQAHREAITVDEEMKVIDIDTTEGDLVSKIREKLSHSAAE
jgi:predicted kinase